MRYNVYTRKSHNVLGKLHLTLGCIGNVSLAIRTYWEILPSPLGLRSISQYIIGGTSLLFCQYRCSTVQLSLHVYMSSQYSTVQYSKIQYSTVQYSTVQYSTVKYRTVQYSTVQYSAILYYTTVSKSLKTIPTFP